MTLRVKVLLANLGALIGVCWLVHLVTTNILTEGFLSVERVSTRQHTERVIDALSEEEREICRRDWAAWDDTYRYVSDLNREYVESNLISDTFASMDVEFLGIYNTQGRQVWAGWRDPGTGKLSSIPKGLQAHLKPDSYLFKHTTAKSSKAGPLTLSNDTLVVGSRPIVRSDYSGKIRGTLVIARRLSPDRLKRLSERVHLGVRFSKLADSKPRIDGVNQELLTGKAANISVNPDSEQSVSGTATLPDIYGAPALQLAVSTPRNIYRKGQETLRSLLWAACGVAAFFVVLCMLLMQQLVLRRLSRIVVDVTDVTTLGELSGRVGNQGTDELGRVTLAINDMLQGAERADAVIRDSEAQARRATQLHEIAARRFEELFEGLPVACFSYDSEGLIHEWNRASEALWGIPASEAVFRQMHEVLEGVDKDRAKRFVERVFSGEKLAGTEWQSKNREGLQMWLYTTTIPLLDSAGRIAGAMSATIDITSRKAAEQRLEGMNSQLEMLAATDGLTGLANQRAFRQSLEAAWAKAKRDGHPLSAILLDVDNFKSFNDTFGHLEGDDVLVQVGRCLRESVRPYDIVARYGGEEFVILLPDTDAGMATQVADRCRKCIESFAWPHRSVTASFGAATWTDGIAEFSHFINLADSALYASKNAGRNLVTHFDQIKKIA